MNATSRSGAVSTLPTLKILVVWFVVSAKQPFLCFYQEMALSKKTDVRKMWQKIPFALDFKIYLFNYTNPEEVQKGATPVVKEIGPYFFE